MCASQLLFSVSQQYWLVENSTYCNLLCVRVEIFSSGAKKAKFFHRKYNSTKDLKTWKMANNCTLLRSLYLLLSTSFCLHISLEQNINFVHEFRTWNIIYSVNFLSQNILVRKRNDKIFNTNYLPLNLTPTKIK